MPHYQRRGDVPRKRHIRHHDRDGRLLYEELMGEEGFSSDSSLLYHRRPPSAIVDARPWELPDQRRRPNHPLSPRHLRLHELFPGEDWKAHDAVTGRRLLLGNADVAITYVAAGEVSPYYRDAVGDECLFVEHGEGLVETVFGPLEVSAGDYVVVPRYTTHRIVPGGEEPLRLYCIEAASHIGPPRRYLSRNGQFLESAPYCERDLRLPGELPGPATGRAGGRTPEPAGAPAGEAPGAPRATAGAPAGEAAGSVEVYVKHRAATVEGVAGTVHVQATHPFDLAGWDGCLYPYALAVADFEPITGRVHQPPPVHQVFEGEGFVVCNFVPRQVDYHPLAVPVPYYHANVDSDEVMLYAAGDYAARSGSGIGPGSVSLHPAGFTHGPQPSAYEAARAGGSVDELAVMVDTFRPLALGEAALAVEDPRYAWSWAGGQQGR